MRFKLCHVTKGEEKKTAYIKEDDAKVGVTIAGWKIEEVSLTSITDTVLKNLAVKKESYQKEEN